MFLGGGPRRLRNGHTRKDRGDMMAKKQLRVVRLLEPELCLECRFGHRADVEMNDGSIQQMVYCKRLDCDNWDYSSAESARSVSLDEASGF